MRWLIWIVAILFKVVAEPEESGSTTQRLVLTMKMKMNKLPRLPIGGTLAFLYHYCTLFSAACMETNSLILETGTGIQ